MWESIMKHNDIKDKKVPILGSYNYENTFNVYLDEGMYYYNLLKNVSFPEILADGVYDVIFPRNSELLPQLSYRMYNVTNLWWLIASVNNILNPLEPLDASQKIKVIKPNYVSGILTKLKEV